MNAINIIKPYKWEGMWVFDDLERGLNHEPFVSGIPQILEFGLKIKGIKNGENGFLLLFSDSEFKSADIILEWVRFECNGDIYRVAEVIGDEIEVPNMEGWLCPALRKYYKDAPNKLYVQAKGI